jgi:hypothetical protein
MSRTLWLLSLAFLLSTNALAQSKFSGKWATEKKPQLLSDNQGVAELELTVGGANGTTVTGTLSVGGRSFTSDKGAVGNGRIWIRTLVGPSTYRTWYGELANDDTLILWSNGLDLVGNDVLDLIQVLPGATAPPAATAAPAADRVASCSGKPQCYVLHRSK